jgi:hypothetical protein
MDVRNSRGRERIVVGFFAGGGDDIATSDLELNWAMKCGILSKRLEGHGLSSCS